MFGDLEIFATFAEHLFNYLQLFTMKTTSTKDIIIEKTFRLLLKKGYDGVSITDIQKETGISRGLLYHYFGNKERLLVEATMTNFLEIFNVDLEMAKNFNVQQMIDYITQKYESVIDKTFGKQTANQNVTIVDYDYLFYRVIRESADFKMKYNRIRDHELIAWKLAINNSKSEGRLSEKVNPDKEAKYFGYLTDGVWMSSVNDNSIKSLIIDLETALSDYFNLLRKK